MVEKRIKAYALKNAIEHNGKAELKNVISKVVGENLKLKKNIKKLISQIQKTINEINKLSTEEQRKQLKSLDKTLLEKKIKETELFSSLNIKKGSKVTTAFPPEPSKYPHIGHAKSILLNYELAKKYKGRFILRFEDTNPVLIKKEFYRIHLNNYKWLGIKCDKIDYASDYINTMYKLAENLIKKSKAYVCSCRQEQVRNNRQKGLSCSCRSISKEDNLKEWNSMLKKGQNILRLKIDLKHKNSAMRDPIIMRVITAKHPRQGKKYKVWPTYDFANSVMDSIERITHRIRSKEFEIRKELHNHIQKSLGFKPTKIYEIGRLTIQDSLTSGRAIREKIESKEIKSWDHPSLTTIVALKRRGFLPEAIKKFVLSTGISKAESTLTWNDLISINKRLIDKKAKRFFFLENPKKIKIKNAPILTVKVPIHPDFPKRGHRKFKTSDKFYIQDKLQRNKVYRLMHLFNFKNNQFLSEELDKKLKATLIHWLPLSKDLIKTEIITPTETKRGLTEPSTKKLKIGEICQFERVGFCRLDKKLKNKLIFYFTHK